VKGTGYPLRHFSLHFPSRASPCAITFQLDSTTAGIFQEGLRKTMDNIISKYKINNDVLVTEEGRNCSTDFQHKVRCGLSSCRHNALRTLVGISQHVCTWHYVNLVKRLKVWRFLYCPHSDRYGIKQEAIFKRVFIPDIKIL
jgi:hypothetical protein